MKIYKKKELPRHEEEEFSVIVLTCDEHGETNLGSVSYTHLTLPTNSLV